MRGINVLGYREALCFLVDVCLRTMIPLLFCFFLVSVDSTDATVLGTRRAARRLACRDVGTLRLPAPKSPSIHFCRTPRIIAKIFPFCPLPTGTCAVLLYLALWLLLHCFCLYAVVSLDVHCTLQWSDSSCSSSFSFSFCISLLMSPRRKVSFCPRVAFTALSSALAVSLCAPVEHKLKRVACRTLATGYWRLSKYRTQVS